MRRYLCVPGRLCDVVCVGCMSPVFRCDWVAMSTVVVFVAKRFGVVVVDGSVGGGEGDDEGGVDVVDWSLCLPPGHLRVQNLNTHANSGSQH